MNEIPTIATRVTFRRFRRWLISPRIVRRLLIAIVVLITLVGILYTEENWRGERAFAGYQRGLEARGEVLDWAAFVPSPVPDEQNVFKAPKMAEWFAGSWLTVTNELAQRLASTNTVADIRTDAAANEYLAWSDQFAPEFDTMRSALTRPYARMEADYANPFAVPVPNMLTVRMVTLTVEQRARCYLVLRQPEKALRELTLLRDLGRSLTGSPVGKPLTTEAAWMYSGVTEHYLEVVANGLELHAWQEPQLAVLEEQMKDIDEIALFARALRYSRALLCYMGQNVSWARIASQKLIAKNRQEIWLLRLATIAPRGWTARWAMGFSGYFQGMIDNYCVTNSFIIPGELARATASWPRLQQTAANYPRAQTMVNEARVACALERYRLAQGNYPETLDALAPRFLEKIPRDLIGGAPLKYWRAENGTFLLYSIGWNETDDGGQVLRGEDGLPDLKRGDWVWRHPILRGPRILWPL
jgi:hypothetical protein